jgi:hypothetical protein
MCVQYWEIIADNLSEADWSWGLRCNDCDATGRTIFVLTRTATTEGVSLCTRMRS